MEEIEASKELQPIRIEVVEIEEKENHQLDDQILSELNRTTDKQFSREDATKIIFEANEPEEVSHLDVDISRNDQDFSNLESKLNKTYNNERSEN